MRRTALGHQITLLGGGEELAGEQIDEMVGVVVERLEALGPKPWMATAPHSDRSARCSSTRPSRIRRRVRCGSSSLCPAGRSTTQWKGSTHARTQAWAAPFQMGERDAGGGNCSGAKALRQGVPSRLQAAWVRFVPSSAQAA
jgi:hypothetical protein